MVAPVEAVDPVAADEVEPVVIRSALVAERVNCEHRRKVGHGQGNSGVPIVQVDDVE